MSDAYACSLAVSFEQYKATNTIFAYKLGIMSIGNALLFIGLYYSRKRKKFLPILMVCAVIFHPAWTMEPTLPGVNCESLHVTITMSYLLLLLVPLIIEFFITLFNIYLKNRKEIT